MKNKLIDIRITVSVPDEAWKTMDDDALDTVTTPFQDLFNGFEEQAKALASTYGFEASVDD